MSPTLHELLTQTRRPRILVAGDVMLDAYIWGDVERISPEAPIPVLQVERREDRLGGAGSVATMLSHLEADVSLAAVTGEDGPRRRVLELLEQLGVEHEAVPADVDRPTTLKERLLGRSHGHHPHQMMRIDHENTRPIGRAIARRLLAAIAERLPRCDLVLLSDYNKGVCAEGFVPELIALARVAGVPVVADPVRGADYRRYAGCRCITPNRTEAAQALDRKIETVEQGMKAAEDLLEFGVESAIVTLDRDGMVWAGVDAPTRHFRGRPREVCDVTGAGDMVLSALGYALACGADGATAIELANLAGGLEVEQLGVAPLRREELLDELYRAGVPTDAKIVTAELLQDKLRRRRLAGQTVVMTNGCYDLIHPGHVASLEQARRLGDCLVVGINSDESVRRLKGPERPVVNQQGRAAMLAALGCVDYVVIFEETSVAPLVEKVLPDVLVKAAQYAKEQVVGHEIVERHGGRVELVEMQSDYSTTGLIERITDTSGRDAA